MVSFSSMVEHWSEGVININPLLFTNAVSTSADVQQDTSDRCSLCEDVQTGLDVTCWNNW